MIPVLLGRELIAPDEVAKLRLLPFELAGLVFGVDPIVDTLLVLRLSPH